MENDRPLTNRNGKICYLQIPADDILVSSTFYHKVFGWNIRKRDNGTLAFDDSEGAVSGAWIKKNKPSAEPGYLVYIMVNDINLSIESVLSNGGKIVQPVGMDAPEITARFSDPAGNIFGLYQEPL